MNIVCQNRKAYHDYHIEEKTEAGIALLGTEVKSLREGKGNLKDSYVLAKDSELFLINCHISPYSHGNITNHEPLRTRKLLLHKKEIEKLQRVSGAKGLTLIPLSFYLNANGIVKVKLGVARGKKLYDKRSALKERDEKRSMNQTLKEKNSS